MAAKKVWARSNCFSPKLAYIGSLNLFLDAEPIYVTPSAIVGNNGWAGTE